jgi:hypothetical protein
MMHRMMFVSLVLIALLLAACGGQPATPAYDVVAPASVSQGSPVPAPTEDVILTVTGAITNKNAGDTLEFDILTLEKLGLVKYTVSDPWENEEVTYTGVLLSELLAVAGVPDSATTVHVVALDDYAADIPISEVEAWPILVATQADGEYLTVDYNGPTRIIFPYDTYSDITAARNMSVWNNKLLEIR